MNTVVKADSFECLEEKRKKLYNSNIARFIYRGLLTLLFMRKAYLHKITESTADELI